MGSYWGASGFPDRGISEDQFLARYRCPIFCVVFFTWAEILSESSHMRHLKPASQTVFHWTIGLLLQNLHFHYSSFVIPKTPSPLFGTRYTGKGTYRLSLILFSNVHIDVTMWTGGKMVDWTLSEELVAIFLKDRSVFPRQKQYPLGPDALKWLKSIVYWWAEMGLLIEYSYVLGKERGCQVEVSSASEGHKWGNYSFTPYGSQSLWTLNPSCW